MQIEQTLHGLSKPCTTCKVWGRVDCSNPEDGPEFDDWIGKTGGKEVCHSCEVQKVNSSKEGGK